MKDLWIMQKPLDDKAAKSLTNVGRANERLGQKIIEIQNYNNILRKLDSAKHISHLNYFSFVDLPLLSFLCLTGFEK